MGMVMGMVMRTWTCNRDTSWGGGRMWKTMVQNVVVAITKRNALKMVDSLKTAFSRGSPVRAQPQLRF